MASGKVDATYSKLKDITPSSVSNFFTPSSGFTMSNLSIKKKNGISYVSCWIKRNADWSAGLSFDIGKVKSDYMPCVSIPIATFDFFGLFAADNGAIIIKPHSSIPANSNRDLVFSYSDNF